MKKIAVFLQFTTIFLSTLLLVTVLVDAYTYAWNTRDDGKATVGTGLYTCTPWTAGGCATLWNQMGTRHKIALILHTTTVPLIISMILTMTLGIFTRVIRKRTAVIILIAVSWLVLLILFASVLLRVNQVEILNCSPLNRLTGNEVDEFAVYYHDTWQRYITLASLFISFVITQILAFGGYIRPMITMLSFDGHFQRYDYPHMDKLDQQNTVTVKDLDSF
ncbi:unnamed protein product [Caenorhabditis sp. 36 PRJEB53466]|nr:unnamed protein product [Caenorhabditis sp. 36 PRJEB53466]